MQIGYAGSTRDASRSRGTVQSYSAADAAVRVVDFGRGLLSDARTVCVPASARARRPHEENDMMAAPEASELNLSMDEVAILDVAAGDGAGEFTIMRPY